ncbi:MAG TPA: cytochrome c biogenesis protein CcdA [Actinomycetota bacterium]|nr:cytochrome c biogenesis protein CcdA [Actinomycetota bacterium]
MGAPVLADLIDTGLASWWAPLLAFAAGVVSFASPCVFPLVPGYLSFVSGQQRDAKPVLPILLFIAGFAVFFTAIGAFSGGVLYDVLKSEAALRVSGVVILLFGVLMLAYAFRVGWPGLFAERRPLLEHMRPGPAWAFPLGLAFAAGWTPCIGPVLAGVLSIAAARGGAARGAFLLLVYSAGLGVPFLLVGLGVRRLVGALSFVKRNYHWFTGVAGVVMVAIGVLIVTDAWTRLIAPIQRQITDFSPPI